jgi:hypothetical protein
MDTDGGGRTINEAWLAFLRQQKVKEPSGSQQLLSKRVEWKKFKEHL